MFTSVVQVVSTVAYAWTSDTVSKGARWPPIVFSGVVNFVIHVSFSVWTIPDGWKWACFVLSAAASPASPCLGPQDRQGRQRGAHFGYGRHGRGSPVFQAWPPLLIWQTVDAPYYRKGFITEIFIAVDSKAVPVQVSEK